MASSSCLLFEDQLQCSICLDVFTDPVSTSCGHNFCMVCLRKCWNSSPRCWCPVCKKEFPTRPELRVNTFISGLAAHFTKPVQVKPRRAPEERPSRVKKVSFGRSVSTVKQSGDLKTRLRKSQAEVQQMIQDRQKKTEAIKRSVELSKKVTEQEKADSVEVFSALVRCIERSQAELLELMEEKQEAAERQAEEFIKELEQEITELKRRDTELEQLSHTEDQLHLLQVYPSLCRPPPTKDWTDVSIDTPLSVENLRRALSQLQEVLSKKMEKLVAIKLRAVQQCEVDVTLDPATAHPDLILSDDRKQVRDGDTEQDLPNNPERFDYYPCVLGKEGFSSGRFYYEVQVSGKTKWALGVTTESSTRKGELTFSPEDGYWIVCLTEDVGYIAVDSSPVLLSLKQAPQKVGVFVEFTEGLVSFYDVEARSHIFSFTGQSFTERLYPYFNPCDSDGGENSAPLIITPVDRSR